MKFLFTGKNTTVSDAMRERAEKKIGKYAKIFRPDTETHVTFTLEKGRNRAEVTISSKGLFIRAEETTEDMYSSIDRVTEKLERQIRKYKTKLGKRIHQDAMVSENFSIEEPVFEEEDLQVVKSKKFPLKPMDVEEAILQMNLLGHSFFVFSNSSDENVNVVYKRKNGSYGLIEPEV